MLNRIKSSIIPLTVVASALIFASTALAVNPPKSAAGRLSQGSSSAGTLRPCQAREAAIKTRMNHLTQLATSIMNKFDKHAQRVEKFYTTKVVPSGKTVTNYDSLVADINTKKVAVQTALTKAQDDVNSFNCSTGNPKAAMTQFRQDMQTVKKALKDFRTSIKNLIVAVRSVTGNEASGSGKVTK